jgi:hypothetical protein
MASLSAYYPLPLVAGTTAGTYAEGDDSRISQLGAGSVVTSTNSNTARSLQERFRDVVNVLDFGADPTGINDSWLAIQRAICAASNHPIYGQNAGSLNAPANTETTLTTGDVDCVLYVNKVFPKLFFVGGGNPVFFPKGNYRVSRPIIVGPATHLVGASGVRIYPINGSSGQFNLIESSFVWLNRTQCNDNIPFQAFAGFDHDLKIEGLKIGAYGSGEGYNNTTQTQQLSFYRLPLMQSGPSTTFNVTGSGNSGENSFTLSGFHLFHPDSKFKFTGHDTVYTYVSRSGNTINITPNLTTTFTNQNLLIGLPANNGIMINGGEDAYIRNCNLGGFTGAGIFVCKGTPAPLIENTMSNTSDIAFWMDAGVNTLIQPSGDGNNVFLRTGYLVHAHTTMINCKVEGQRLPTSVSAVVSGAPYPFATSNRSAIEFGSWAASGPSHLTVINGSFNIDYGIFGNDAYGDTHPFISAFRDAEFPRVKLFGTKQLGYRNQFYKCTYVINGDTDFTYKRRKIDDFEDDVSIGGETILSWYDDTNFPNAFGTKFLTRGSQNDGDKYGIYGDQGSGILENTSSYSRSGTTATFTYYASDGTTPAAHGLQAGDVVIVRYPSGFNSADRLNPNTTSGNGYYTGAMIIKSVTTNTFTTTVLDSGGLSGSGVKLQVCKIFFLHGIDDGEHYIQMPQDLGESGSRRALTIRDKQGRYQAGLRVATANTGDWWANNSLNIGGTIDNPSARILTGTDAPSISAPNGSIYLRTGATADTTLYVRAGDAWTPLTST